MCGIAGVWKSTDVSLVNNMLQDLAHRGPDDEGIHEVEHGILGHQRLAIVDPAHGHQPLCTADPQRPQALIANGEIYNAPALRARLEPRHQYQTHSDSESILHLYAEAGVDTATQLDGMFAFALADRDRLYMARDPIGIKPLYYGHKDDELVFASEIKALAGRVSEIEEFPPGTWYDSDSGFHTYYEVPRHQPQHHRLDVVIDKLRETLERAVIKRLMADVPVGAFLSGGLDSSLVAAIARKHVDHLHTFSVGLPGSADLEAARAVAKYLDTDHHEYLLNAQEIEEKLPEIIFYLESYDRDLVHSAVPCYFVSRLAAEHVRVVLTGEGADELFAGYQYYRAINNRQLLHQELSRSVSALHNLNLQRVDRMTMAHGLEARVPFLDVEMIDLAQTITPRLKLAQINHGQRVEKWILRRAFEDLLPPEIVWRDKAQFDQGTGTTDIMMATSPPYLEATKVKSASSSGPSPRSPEEQRYHDLLAGAFCDPQPVLATVARWEGSNYAESNCA